MPTTEQPTVGWREWVRLPDLGVDAVKAKVDTGARTSAIHAWDVRVADDVVHFVLHPHQDDDESTITATAPLVDQREVRSSNGEVELRPVVRTTVTVGEAEATIELTLTSRDEMGFRMLLGREALRALGALVDPAASFVHGGTRFRGP